MKYVTVVYCQLLCGRILRQLWVFLGYEPALAKVTKLDSAISIDMNIVWSDLSMNTSDIVQSLNGFGDAIDNILTGFCWKFCVTFLNDILESLANVPFIYYSELIFPVVQITHVHDI